MHIYIYMHNNDTMYVYTYIYIYIYMRPTSRRQRPGGGPPCAQSGYGQTDFITIKITSF